MPKTTFQEEVNEKTLPFICNSYDCNPLNLLASPLPNRGKSLKAPPLHLYPENLRNPAEKAPQQTQDFVFVLKFP